MYNFIYGIKNLVKWFRLIWKDRDYDWAFLARMMELKFRGMCEESRNGHHLSSPAQAKQLLICAHLCKRMTEDDYWKQAEKRHPTNMRLRVAFEQHLGKSDQEMLGKMISKYFRHWWE